MTERIPLPARFRVEIEGLDRRVHLYDVCTSFGRDKAIALAAVAHYQRSPEPSGNLYRVSGVSNLEGERPQDLDLAGC